MYNKIILSFVFLLLPLQLIAAEVEMTVDQNNITTEDQVVLKVTVSGARDLDSAPYVAGFENFQVEKAGTSSQVQIINGQMSVQKVFNFVLYPKKEGEFKVGPASIDYNGQSLNSSSVVIKVSKTAATTVSGKGLEDKYYFVQAEVSNKNPYVGEQITYSFKFFSRASVANANLDAPKFDSFWKEDVGKQKDYTTTINGIRWDVTEVTTALFANSPGKYTIDPATLIIDVIVQSRSRGRDSLFDSFFSGMGRQTKRVRLKTALIEIDVQDLPKAQMPANFTSLVGDFSLKADLSKNVSSVGASTTMTVVIEGEGNIRDAKLPPLNFDKFKTYDDRPQVEVDHRNGKIIGKKTFKVALVPQEEGVHQIGPVEISFFNPKSGTYKTASSAPLTIDVKKGSVESTNHLRVDDIVPSKKTVEVMGKDLMPLKRNIHQFALSMVNFKDGMLIFVFIFLMPFFYFLLRWLKRRRDLILGDVGLMRKGVAYKNFQSGLKKIKSNSPQFWQDISSILRLYLGDKLNIDGKALTSRDVDSKLASQKVSVELVADIKDFLRTCEMGVYGGGSANLNSQQALDKVEKMAKILEKEIR